MKYIFAFLLRVYSIKIIKFGLIPLVLFIFWILASIMLVYPPSFSVVSKYNDKSDFENFSTKKIFKDNKITGFIEASENNFGILIVRFNPSKQVEYRNEDTLLFKIKEIKKDQWIARNSYKSGLISETPIFPFGFPPIKNSKGKVYEFQILSLNGNEQNAVSLSSVSPILTSQYKFSGVDMRRSGRIFSNVIFIKVQTFLTDTRSIFLSFPYLLPLLIYLFSMFVKRAGFPIFYITLLFILISVLVSYVAITITTYPIGDIVLVYFWILSLKKYKLDGSVSFFFSAVFMLMSIFGVILNQSLLLQKSSDWTYYLLAIGIFQTILEIKNNQSGLISAKSLFKNSLSFYEK